MRTIVAIESITRNKRLDVISSRLDNFHMFYYFLENPLKINLSNDLWKSKEKVSDIAYQSLRLVTHNYTNGIPFFKNTFYFIPQ